MFYLHFPREYSSVTPAFDNHLKRRSRHRQSVRPQRKNAVRAVHQLGYAHSFFAFRERLFRSRLEKIHRGRMRHRLRLRIPTVSYWLRDNTLQYLEIERFSPILVRCKRVGNPSP
jgi:hypothetical protein